MAVTLAQRTFSQEDQQAFATYSGDFNPMHVDPLYARRLAFGTPIVHGAHLALWAIEVIDSDPQCVSGLKANFNHVVRIGEPVRLEVTDRGPGRDEISVISRGRVACALSIEWSADGLSWSDEPPQGGCASGEPKTHSEPEIRSACGTMVHDIDRESGTMLFPKVSARAPGLARTIAGTSRLIGMECPGLNSVFSSLTLRFASAPDVPAGVMEWRVASFDERFSRLLMSAKTTNAALEMSAFVRPTPQAQPSSAQLRSVVAQDAYTGRQALVVGGSRGLGELCAKLLAAGGADVCITYRVGQADADAVVADIVQAGGRARAMPFDVLRAAEWEPDDLSDWLPTHLYYFATPSIFVGTRRFSNELFEMFCRYYVTGFVDTVRRFYRKGPLRVFYPSTVAISTTTPGMEEYAAAKAAGEATCRQLPILESDIAVDVVRLPRLPTDQTTSLFPVETGDPVPILLGVLESA